MRVEFNRTGAERKALVTAIGEILGTKPKYKGMPTAAYDFGGLIVDKTGALEFDENIFPKDIEELLKKLADSGFVAEEKEIPKEPEETPQGEDAGLIEELCHTKGTWAGKKFELIDWQEQIIRDLFGVLKPNGYRQFNTAYIEIPKKQGKSELAAAVALLLLCGDGEERAEVYGCAADRNQAKIVFDVAVDMVKFSPALLKRVKILESQKKLIYKPTNSFYQVLSADVANKHGFNTHGVIFDELHTQPNRKLYDVMTQGSGDARMQPLYFLITTAGNDTNSICYEIHQKALDIQAGRIMRCDSDSGKKLIKSMVLRTADRQGMC